MAEKTPKGFRLHIGIFGRRNVGKSSLLNAITRQNVSIVSDQAGTTTDPVEKPMELLPLGPVLFIDTAGIDDVGALGELRIQKTRAAFDRSDMGVIVCDALWGDFEEKIMGELQKREIPFVVVFNKIDRAPPPPEIVTRLRDADIVCIETAANAKQGIAEFRQALLDGAPADFVNNPVIAADLVGPGEVAILVTPIDKEAPKGRLILPQVQTIRDLLDHGAFCVVAQDAELPAALASLSRPPKIVITDSQAFDRVAEMTPPGIPLTSFSILYSRFKGDIVTQTRGTLAVRDLRPGDRVLVAEACSHHPIEDDIGRVKIPRWLNNFVGGELEYHTMQGRDFPENLSEYKIVIHCGACMWNRRSVLSRLLQCRRAGVPMTNYGLLIAYSIGIFERALAPFPEALAIYRQAIEEGGKRE